MHRGMCLRVLTGVRGWVGGQGRDGRRCGRFRRLRWRLGRWRRLGGVGARARAGRAHSRLGRRRIFRDAGGRRRAGAGRAGGRRAERDQPQQRHAPPPEHGGQRAGSASDAARGLLETEIRAPLTRAPPSFFTRLFVRRRDG